MPAWIQLAWAVRFGGLCHATDFCSHEENVEISNLLKDNFDEINGNQAGLRRQ
jgi:hypothetical protein